MSLAFQGKVYGKVPICTLGKDNGRGQRHVLGRGGTKTFQMASVLASDVGECKRPTTSVSPQSNCAFPLAMQR
jgi:hypothetical protein